MLKQKSRTLGLATLFALAVGCGSNNNTPVVARIEFAGQQITVYSGDDVESVHTACDGEGIYMSWSDDGDVYFSRSTNGGATWSTAVQLDTSTAARDAGSPALFKCGSTLYVVWGDDRTGFDDIYLNFSTDSGLTWQSDEIRVSHSSDARSRDAQLCCDGLSVYIVWSDERDGEEDIYLNRSTDGGATWLADDIRVERGTAGAHDSENPFVCCDGATVVVLWEDKKLGGEEDIFTNRSTDGGDTWQAQDTRLDVTDTDNTDVDDFQVCCSGTYIYAVWQDDRSGEETSDIYVNASSDFGVTWLTEEVRVNTDAPEDGYSEFPRICCNGEHVYIAWDDNRNFATSADETDANIRFNASYDAGATWFSSDLQVDDSETDADELDIACEGNAVYIVWEDERNEEDGDVYMNGSATFGQHWRDDDIHVDTASDEDTDPDDIGLCIGPGFAAVVWRTDDTIYIRVAQR